MKAIDDIEVDKKKVFVRLDLDCNSVSNTELLNVKINNCLPTLRYLLEREAKVVIGSHIGKPGQEKSEKNSFEAVGWILSELLNKDVYFVDTVQNDAFKKLLSDVPFASVILLENMAFGDIENENGDEFFNILSEKTDIYVNEAFSISDSPLYSVNSVFNIYDRDKIAVGLNFKYEYQHLLKMKRGFERPLVLFLNGKEVLKKIDFAFRFLDETDAVVMMGEVANTHSKVLKSSFSGEYDRDSFYSMKNLISSAATRKVKIFKIGKDTESEKFYMQPDDVIYLNKALSGTGSVVWLGKVELLEEFKSIFENPDVYKCTLGKEANMSLSETGSESLFDFISRSDDTGLDYLLGNQLGVLEKLEQKGR